MRELDAAKFILDQALLKVRQPEVRVRVLHLLLGEISELDQNSIRRNWEEISKGTSAAGAQLRFRTIAATVQCMACFQTYDPENGKILCPYCGSMGAKILSGEEFSIESMEMDDA
jgi:hydrogenase nickel incorporation protein HypA/HybF